MRIIAAMDIIEGKCVRLSMGDFRTRKIYDQDPVELASQIEDNGIGYLHIVDLDGARNKNIENIKVLERIAVRTGLKIDFGGGLKTFEDIKTVINAGAGQVTIGSIAVADPGLFTEWFNRLGPEIIILGADCKNRMISIDGWTESSEKEITSFVSDYYAKGVKYVICTDIEKDGMLTGPSTELYKDILSVVEVNLIASGGISSLNDLDDVREAGCEGVIVGKAIYEGIITLKELGKLC